jgi:alpha-1,3-mannosyltransferase
MSNAKLSEASGGPDNKSRSTNNFFLTLYIELAQQRPWDWVFVALLLLAESILGLLIIWKVPYTEIDWIAYMQEVDTWWLEGEYDYRNIRGDTGPLVYPAGFLYLFVVLQWFTNRHIPTAQFIFWVFYLLTQGIVLVLYTTVLQFWREQQQQMELIKSDMTKDQKHSFQLRQSHMVWSFRVAMGCLCLSKRYHSIFLLRLFNDGPTMLVTYLSFWCFVHSKWNIGCLVFSMAVSIKMNVLLFAPGLLFLLIEASPRLTIPRLAICGISQLIFGAPFLLRYPVSYLRKAFELDRQFFYKWTVNFKFLSEEVFLSKQWSIFLLVSHVGLLCWYLGRLGFATRAHRRNAAKDGTDVTPFRPDHVLLTLFVSNFIGICCSRSLHYQFYCWYFSSLPLLLWQQGTGRPGTSTCYPLILRLICLASVEYAFLTFPATPVSSLVLQMAHWSILIPHLVMVGTGSLTTSQKQE